MKKKVTAVCPVTEEQLKKALNDYPNKTEAEFIIDSRIDKLDMKFEEIFGQSKSDMFTRFDELMGELSQMREDRVFEEHDVKVLKDRSNDYEKRIEKLESSQSTS